MIGLDSSMPPPAEPPAPAGEQQGPDQASYLSTVWAQLKKNRISLWGVWCIGALVILAIFAPVISLNQPFYFSADGVTRFPFLRSLFNRLLFENSVDIFFNLALVLLPLYLAIVLGARKRWGASFTRLKLRLLLGLAVGHVILASSMLPASMFGVNNPLFFTEKVENYAARAAEYDAQGKSYTAVFPLRRFGYRDTDPEHSVAPPSGRHWLGTDYEGRDVFARMLYGTRISLTIGIVAVAIYVSIGIVLGALAGYYGRWVDNWISRLIEVMICFPSFFLILTIAALIEKRSIFHVMLIIGFTGWTGVARLIRAEFLKQTSLDYVQAARALGLSERRIIFRHILPNAVAPVLVSATFGIAAAILIESSLAFLGVGDPSVASWGETLNTGRTEHKLWLVLAPGFAIFFVVSVFNLVGEGLRDALDPRLRR
ncbi:MAG TPA: ABC transporter permease [Polyangiaceae bacterium]